MPTTIVIPTRRLRSLDITVDPKDLDTVKAAILGRLQDAADQNHLNTQIEEVDIEIIPLGANVRITVTADPDNLTPTQINNWI
jgi:hypothetical protein